VNSNLELKNQALSSASTLDSAGSLSIDQEMKPFASFLEPLLLKDILKEIGPLPPGALFLGLADDGLPVLLNLWDPKPGPILVTGDPEAGKTDFLKTITSFVVSTHQPHEIQYAVITERPVEWKNYVNYDHCIGVFSMVQKSTVDLIQALVIWVEMNRSSRQAVMLLVDGMEDFVYLNNGLGLNFQTLLMHGPAKRIWPVVTFTPGRFQGADTSWLKYFRTRMFGYMKNVSFRLKDSVSCFDFEALSKGVEFSMKENAKWIKFRIPRI
jgi:hypothetical protein